MDNADQLKSQNDFQQPVLDGKTESDPKEIKGILGYKNYATRDSVKDYITANILPYIKKIIDNRRPQEDIWIDNYKMYNMEISGAFNSLNPVKYSDLHRMVEDMTTFTNQQMFPNDDYMTAVSPKTDKTSEENAKFATLFLKSDFRRAKLKNQMRLFLKQLWMQGTSASKCDWYVDETHIIDREEKLTLNSSQQNGEVTVEDIEGPKLVEKSIKEGYPTFEAVSIFNLYAYPDMTPDLTKAEIVFYNTYDTFENIEQKEKDGVYVDTEKLRHGKFNKKQASRDPLELDAIEMMSKADNLKYRNIQFVYTKIPFQKDGPMKPALIVLSGQTILRVQRNPYFLQRPPFQMVSLDELMKEMYGRSRVGMAKSVYLNKNDMMNQIISGMRYANNPIGLINPDSALGKIARSIKLKPALILPAKPGDLSFEKWPAPAPESYQYLDPLSNEISDTFGFNPAMAGGVSSSAIRTNKMQQAAAAGATIALKDIAEHIEQEVLVEAAKWFYSLRYQHSPDKQLDTSILGADVYEATRKRPKFIDVKDDYAFFFLGSMKSFQNAVLNQQMMQFLNMIVPFIPRIKEEGYDINITYMARKIYTDGFLLKGENEVFKKINSDPIPPKIAVRMLLDGQEVGISEADEDPVCIAAAMQEIKKLDSEGEDVENIAVSALLSYVSDHLKQWKMKQAKQAAMQKVQMAQIVGKQSTNLVNQGVEGMANPENNGTNLGVPASNIPGLGMNNSAPTGETSRSPEALKK